MKRTLLTTLLVILLSANIFAQNNPINEMSAKKAYDIEIYDISGTKHKGKLFYADSNHLVISKNKFTGDSLFIFSSDQIYSIKASKKGNFVLPALITSAFIGAVLTTIAFSDAEASMIGPGFVFVYFSVVYGSIPGIIGGTIFKTIPTKKINYITDGSSDKFQLSLPILINKYNSLEKNITTENSIIFRNQSELDKLKKPNKYFHPLSSPKFHFELSVDLNTLNPVEKIRYTLTPANNLYYNGLNKKQPRFSGTFSYNLLKHFQAYINYSNGYYYYTYGSSVYSIDSLNYYDDITLKQFIQSASVGFNYVFNPVNRILQKRYQISVGLGFTMNQINNATKMKTLDKSDEFSIPDITKYQMHYSQGVKISSDFKYFVHKNISLNVGLYGDILNNTEIDATYGESANGRRLDIPSYTLNLSSFYVKFGVELHF